MIQRNSIQSGEYIHLDRLMEALMDLPPTLYIQGTSKSFNPADGYEIDMNCAGVTAASSAKPVLATKGLTTCMGVSVFNPESRTGGIAHLAQDSHDSIHLAPEGRKALKSLLAAARGDGEGRLEVRISGPPMGGGFADVFIKDVLLVLNETPNLTFLSADFRGKDYPSSVGIDTRRWEEGLLKGKSTAQLSYRDAERLGREEVVRRIAEGIRGAVNIEDIPPAPGYDEGNLFDARALAKFSDRGKPSGTPERK